MTVILALTIGLVGGTLICMLIFSMFIFTKRMVYNYYARSSPTLAQKISENMLYELSVRFIHKFADWLSSIRFKKKVDK